MASIINSTTTAGVTVTGDNSGSLQLATNNGTTAVTITTAQNVGIGTTTPTAPLDITSSTTGYMNITGGSSSGQGSFIRFRKSATDVGYLGTSSAVLGNSTSDFLMYADGAGAANSVFWTNGQERMRIDTSGNVLIGGTSFGSIDQNAVLIGVATGRIIHQHATGTVTGTGYSVFQYAATTIGSITQSGTTAVAYNTSSDYRLKENIAPMTGALAKVTQLKPVTYKWKVDGSDGQGFIAHELAEVVPDCVSGEKDAVETYTDEDGNEQTRIKAQGIDTSFLVATLTSAIQELNAKVDAQAVRIAELEGAI